MAKDLSGELLTGGSDREDTQIIANAPSSFERAWAEGCIHLRNKDWKQLEQCLNPYARKAYLTNYVELRLAIALHGQNRLEEAISILLPTLKNNDDPECQVYCVVQYGLACLELGLEAHWLQILELLRINCKMNKGLRYLRSLALLVSGHHEKGWDEHEHRPVDGACEFLQTSSLRRLRELPSKKGARLLLVAEQGYGDMIQFARFATIFRCSFKYVDILAPEVLIRLLASSMIFDKVIAKPGNPDDLEADYWLPLMSAPKALKLKSLHEFGCKTYIKPDVDEARRWRLLLHENSKAPLIAINWSGNLRAESPLTTHRERSLQISDFEKIGNLDKARLISIQTGERSMEIQGSTLNQRLVSAQKFFNPSTSDFQTTAAILKCCDLLITNDTSVAHLGGALGLKTWVLLKCHASWQWPGQEHASCLYESVRRFHQVKPFCWEMALANVDDALEFFIKNFVGPAKDCMAYNQ